jgi:glycosyltransferase involved in cell wall biosynthesis
MKTVIYFAYKVNGVLDTPTSLIYPYLNTNHRVTMMDGFHTPFESLSEQFDWGVSVHENIKDIINAKRLSKKHYMHLEWLIPWKVNHDCYGRKWEYPRVDRVEEHAWRSTYKEFAKFFLSADVKSLASKYFVPYMEEIFGAHLGKYRIKYPSADAELCKCAYNIFNNQARTITTVSRLVPHKRTIQIAKALAKWNKPVTWNLVGQGPDLDKIKEIISGSDILFNYRGWVNGAAKLQFMKNALCIHGWNGIQPSESLLMESFNLSMDDPVMREYFDDAIEYYDSVDDLVDKIDYFWNNPEECLKRAKMGKDRLLAGTLNANTAEQEAHFISDILDEA